MDLRHRAVCSVRHGYERWRTRPAIAGFRPGVRSRQHGIAGGAVYDALVALAAREHGAALATRDARARGTQDAVGVEVIVVT